MTEILNGDGEAVGTVDATMVVRQPDGASIQCVKLEIGPFGFGFDPECARNMAQALLAAADLVEAKTRGLN